MHSLPYLVLQEIFSYLNVKDSCSARLVSLQWNEAFLGFRNLNFKNSLHYVHIETNEQLALFLTTFAQSQNRIPFPRLLWNVYAGTDSEVNDLGNLYASRIVELCIVREHTDDLLINHKEECRTLPFSERKALKRISTILEKMAGSLEVVKICAGYTSVNVIQEGIPVPRLPKLQILDVGCRYNEWYISLIQKAPELKFVTLRALAGPFQLNVDRIADIAKNKNLQELNYPYLTSHSQQYSEKWILANLRRYMRTFSPLGDGAVEFRLLHDQVNYFKAINFPFSFIPAVNIVFPRVQQLRTSPLTWLQNPLQVFSPTKLPQLKSVILCGNSEFTEIDFPKDLSHIYPNVVELVIDLHSSCIRCLDDDIQSPNSKCVYKFLPYYKLFPNVIELRLKSDVVQNIIALLNNFNKVRVLVLNVMHFISIDDKCGSKDFKLHVITGASPDISSFNRLERLEYRYIDSADDLPRLIHSLRTSQLASLKSLLFWNVIPPVCLQGSRCHASQKHRDELVKRELPNIIEFQQLYKIEWWIRYFETSGDAVTEQLT